MSRRPWPPPLEPGEELVAQGRPSLRRRLVETAWVTAIAAVINSAIELWQGGTITVTETATFIAVFGTVYLLFAMLVRRGEDWVLTDRRYVQRRGSTLPADEVARVTPGRHGLTLMSKRNRNWLIEPLADPEATARRLDWGAP